MNQRTPYQPTAMTFESLKIEAEKWGENKGKLTAEITIKGKNAKTCLILPDSVGDEILQLAKSAIIDAVEQSANDFIFEITTAIPKSMTLTNKQP